MCVYVCKHVWMYVCIRCPSTELTRQFKNSYFWFLALRNLKVKFCFEKITFEFLWGSFEYHVYSCFWYFTEAVLLQNRHIGAFNVADYKALGRPFSANQALFKGWNWKRTSKLLKSRDLKHFWRLEIENLRYLTPVDFEPNFRPEIT